MQMHENIIALSSANLEYRPRKYLGAIDAVCSYYEFCSTLLSLPAQLYEADIGDGEDVDDYRAELITDIRQLVQAFEHGERKSRPVEWRAWRFKRIENRSYRNVPDTPRSTAAQLVLRVDAWIEEWLDAQGLLYLSEQDEPDEVRESRLDQVRGGRDVA